MNQLTQDLRFTVRLMRKSQGTTLLVILALALGIGLNAAIFSVVNAVLLRPLPVFEPERIVWLHSKVNKTGATLGTSYPDYLDWKSQSRSFESMAAMWALTFTMTGSGPAEHVKATAISAAGFKTWGVHTALGRDFADNDDRADSNRVAVLNYAFWQRKFGGDIGVLGRSLVLDNESYTVIGVLQPTQVKILQYPDVWIAIGPRVDSHIMERDTRYFFPVARLKPNVSLLQAQTEMEAIAGRLSSQYQATNKDMGIGCAGFIELLTGASQRPLWMLVIASSFIFLLAVVNVTAAFMSATVERGQELSVRLAVGASRSRLLRQLLVQAAMFSAAGGAVGLLLAKFCLMLFLVRFPLAVARFQETTIDWRVVLATIGMAVAASLIATLGPAFYAFKIRMNSVLANEWSVFGLLRHGSLGRGALIFFQVALASGLSLVSGLLIKSFYEVEKVDLGFNPNHIFSFQVTPPVPRYKEPAKQSALYKASVDALAKFPGMQKVSAISSLPLTSQGLVNTLEVDGESPLFGQPMSVEEESILPGLFQTMRLPLLQGRDFTEEDREGTPSVIIVDDVFAARVWPGKNPLGKRVRMSVVRGEKTRWLEVVGVAREIKHFGPERAVRWMQVYVPQYQDPSPVLSFVVNTALPYSVAKREAEEAFHQLDQDIPVEQFQTLDAYLDTVLSPRKVSLLLLSGFAATGIVLGMIGVFGAVSNAVVQQRREIAIRIALGATRAGTMILVTKAGLLATLAGILVGSGIVISLTRLIASFLFGVSPLYPTVYVVSAVILMALALVASSAPAMRLLHFNVQEILRQ